MDKRGGSGRKATGVVVGLVAATAAAILRTSSSQARRLALRAARIEQSPYRDDVAPAFHSSSAQTRYPACGFPP